MNRKNKYKIVFFIFLCGQVFFGQDQKKKLSEKEYERWHILEDENIAPNGKWVSFLLNYNNENDTLVLKNTKNEKTFFYPKAASGKFSSNSKWFLYYENQNELILVDLDTNKKQSFSEVKSYQIDDQSKILAVLKTSDTLSTINLISGETNKLNNVKEYSFSSSGILAIIKEVSVSFINPIHNLKDSTIATGENGFKNLVWNQNKGFAFFQNLEVTLNTNQSHKINYFDYSKKKLYKLNPNDFSELNEKSIVKPFGQKAILIEHSDDKIIFFINNRKKKESKAKEMEIWESDSPLEYPSQELKGNFENSNKMAIWWPTSNELKVVGNNQKPNTIVCPDSNYILSFNPLDYEPQFELAGPVDLYLTNLKTNKTMLLLEKQSQKVQTMGASSAGRYLHYYRDKNWWVYDLAKETHSNITKDLPFTVENYKQDEAGPKYAFGCAGWSSDNKHVFIYDEFDIWMISADGKTKNRITNGRESKKQFRVEEDLYVNKFHRGSIEFLTNTLDVKEGITLSVIDQNKNIGFYVWNEKENLKKIYLENSKSNRIKYASKGNELIWIEQDATKPPRLLLKNTNKSNPITVHQSNEHYLEYGTSKAELVEYTNSKGDSLKGVLYYPYGYKKEKKYPMVVYIYEKLSQRLHLYENPNLYNRDGFSMANYVYDDYFVLYPDIIYEIGNPGISAKDCVVSAVNEVIKTGKIDKDKIGIIGHSFGGYQVASIITQTNVFKTAVAGAAVTDLTNLYLQMNWEWNRTQAWRFESQQMRMGSNPFDNFAGYKNNSPISNASKINTPLLSWSGKEDYNVNWNQSIYLHMALRRLKKKNKLLLFPDEGHGILKMETQMLLSKEIKNWFDSYLKP